MFSRKHKSQTCMNVIIAELQNILIKFDKIMEEIDKSIIKDGDFNFLS